MPSTIAALSTARPSVQLVQLDELPALRIHNAHGDALIALQGAQVLEFTPRGQRPVIWLSEQAAFRRGQNIRGGIPICWPWFGELARNPAGVRAAVSMREAPAHGLVRAQNWLLESIAEQPEYTEVVLRYPTAALFLAWPQQAELTLTIRIGATLRLQLTTRNRGDNTFVFTQALHTYFAISGIQRIAIHGFEQSHYLDTLNAWREIAEHDVIRIDGEVDRIYQQVPEQVQLCDNGWQRTIFIRAHNSSSAVIWNPHVEKSKRLNQLAGDAWQRMVCIETANIMSDQVTLTADAEHRLDVEIGSIEHARNA